LLELVLTRAGFRVWLGRDGTEALTLAREQGEELLAILLDIQLPDRDGVAVLGDLRREGVTAPCFLMSGSCEAAPTESLRHCPAGFFPKPFRLTEMVEALTCLARRAELP
jgi:two-component system copper resistance phosphate regulon response regulator CusR